MHMVKKGVSEHGAQSGGCLHGHPFPHTTLHHGYGTKRDNTKGAKNGKTGVYAQSIDPEPCPIKFPRDKGEFMALHPLVPKVPGHDPRPPKGKSRERTENGNARSKTAPLWPDQKKNGKG